MTRVEVRLVLLLAIVGTVGCDRVTKQVAASTLADAPTRSFLGDTIRLEYAENAGAFLGLGADWPPTIRTAVFIVGNGLILLALPLFSAFRPGWPYAARFGTALVAAGGISNLLDRIAYEAVVDFMNVGIGPLRTGIFNVADVAIMLGAGLLVLGVGRRRLHSQAHERHGAP